VSAPRGIMKTKEKEIARPFVCNVADCLFLIKYYETYEMHIFTCKSEPNLNWTEKISK